MDEPVDLLDRSICRGPIYVVQIGPQQNEHFSFIVYVKAVVMRKDRLKMWTA